MMYIVQTGTFLARQEARNMEQAVVEAFKWRAPKAPAALTKVRYARWGHAWHHISTETMLKSAGLRWKSIGFEPMPSGAPVLSR